MDNNADNQLLKEAQRLLDHHAHRLTDLSLKAVTVNRHDGIVQILVRPSRMVHSEEFVSVLAAVESDLDAGQGDLVLLVPVIDEAA